MLYRKNGGPPQQLPEVDYDENGLPYTHLTQQPDVLAMLGWEPAPPMPAFDPSTHTAIWQDDDWVVIELPPPPPATPIIRRIPKVDFWRRFTEPERVALLAARKTIEMMSPEDFASIESVGWWQLAAVFQTLDMIVEYIELDHPETSTALDLFETAGYIAEGRKEEILE